VTFYGRWSPPTTILEGRRSTSRCVYCPSSEELTVVMQPLSRISGLVVLGSMVIACSGTDSQGPATNSAGGNTGTGVGSGGSSSAVSQPTGGAIANSNGGGPTGGVPVGAGGKATGGAPPANGGSLTGGAPFGTGGKATGGTPIATGGSQTGGATLGIGGGTPRTDPVGSGGKATGGAPVGTAGKATGGAAVATGGTSVSAGAGGSSGAGTGGCTVGTWPTADPAAAGPYAVTLEENIGPTAGTENAHFDVIRPTDLAKTDLCHPLITWGNGHGDNPPTYMVLLKQLASHGFVVVASLTKTASQGTPLPQVAGIDWILQENDLPTSAYYRRIDTTHIGANGHSEGGMASTMAGSDARVKAIATLCGARANANLHGPALLLCGGADTVATCSGMQSAFDGITQPVMLASQLTATHGSWIGSIKDPFMIAVTSWMRLHLMGDTAQKKMFYGTDCSICANSAVWKVLGQKGLD
jgi:hypothetical protein